MDFERNIKICKGCDTYTFDTLCLSCSKLLFQPNERSSEMNTLTNGGIIIGSEANGETSLR
jgi:hypothetical protein